MNDLDRSIIATLSYYGAFSWPLTLMEIAERRIPSRRLGGRDDIVPVSSLLERLDRLVAMELAVQENGLYAPAGALPGFGDRRVEQEKIWAQKWRRMLRKAWWLQSLPFVKGLYASGSLALGNMSSGSDWDMFVIVQAGHLYTARISLLLHAWLLRSLRTKRDRTASDKFCFNHYVTTDGLAIRHHSIYVAHGLSALVPIMERGNYLERLWQANQWMGDFLAMPTSAQFVRRSIRPSRILGAIRSIRESILAGPLGRALERGLKAWQQRRIRRTPATHERGGRVTADDRELEFHPHSFEAVALARYNAALDKLGLGSFRERDSGLTR